MLEKLHFDNAHPENHNVCVKEREDEPIGYVDNSEWNVAKKHYVIQ